MPSQATDASGSSRCHVGGWLVCADHHVAWEKLQTEKAFRLLREYHFLVSSFCCCTPNLVILTFFALSSALLSSLF